MGDVRWAGVAVAVLLSACVLQIASAVQPVDDGRAVAAREWPSPGGDWASTRYSTLTQINTRNVAMLRGAWTVEFPDGQASKASVMVKGDRLFATTTAGEIIALDPAAERTLWTYKPEAPFSGSRGVGLGEGFLFAGLRDSSVVAISQETGKVVWTHVRDAGLPAQAISTAPAYGGGVVVAVVSGGDNFARGRAMGIDAKTGKGLWNFEVVPAPGEQGHETWPKDSDIWKYGGGAIWTTPSIDAELGLVYLETGNAVPQWGGELRAGDNLFNNSVVALDLKTGRLRWYFQLIHHDIWEHDVSTPLVLYDATIGGRLQKVVAAMRTDGVLFLLDRQTGQPILPVEERPVKQDAFLKTAPTQPFTVGADRVGPGCVDKSAIPSAFIAGCYFDPVGVKTRNLYLPQMNMRQAPMAYSPQTGYLYATACVNPAWFRRAESGWAFVSPARPAGVPHYGVIAAIDGRTGKMVWQKRLAYSACGGSGVTASAGGLVFHVEPDGYVQAYDARRGDLLWQFQTGELGASTYQGPSAGPVITYESHGTQHVAFAINHHVWALKLGGTLAPRLALPPPPTATTWDGRVEDTNTIQLGMVTPFTIRTAGRQEVWTNEDGLTPMRARVEAGTPVTFTNTTTASHTIAARDGSWSTGPIAPGASGTVTVATPGLYEYVCTEHPWAAGQLIVK